MKYSTSLQFPSVENSYEPRPVGKNLADKPTNLASEEPRNLGKQEPRQRGKQLNVEINAVYLKRLKHYALEHDMSLIEAVEYAISLLEAEKPRSLGHDDDDHDDLKGRIINQSVRDEFKKLTDRNWKSNDTRSLLKLALPVEEIIALMRDIASRVPDPSVIRNFEYFVVSINNEPKKGEDPKLEERYRKLLKDASPTYAGGEFTEEEWLVILQRLCAARKVAWNEAAAKKALAPKAAVR